MTFRLKHAKILAKERRKNVKNEFQSLPTLHQITGYLNSEMAKASKGQAEIMVFLQKWNALPKLELCRRGEEGQLNSDAGFYFSFIKPALVEAETKPASFYRF